MSARKGSKLRSKRKLREFQGRGRVFRVLSPPPLASRLPNDGSRDREWNGKWASELWAGDRRCSILAGANRAGSWERERQRNSRARSPRVTALTNRKLAYSPPVSSSYRALKADFADLVFFRGCNFNPIYKFFERALFFSMVSRGNILILFDNDDSFGRGKAILYAFLNTEIKTANNLSFLNECWWWNYRLYEGFAVRCLLLAEVHLGVNSRYHIS